MRVALDEEPVLVDRAEPASDGEVVLLAQLLVAEEQQAMFVEQGSYLGEGLVVDGAQVDTGDLDPGAGVGMHFHGRSLSAQGPGGVTARVRAGTPTSPQHASTISVTRGSPVR